MYILFAFFSIGAFANTFEWKGVPDFKLVINSRHFTYSSAVSRIGIEIKECNLPLVRALNEELMNYVPQKETRGGETYLVDANSYYLSPRGESVTKLRNMDVRVRRFVEEERKLCQKKGP